MENNPDLQLMRQRHRQRLIGVGVLAMTTAVGVPLLLDQARAPKEEAVSQTSSPASVVPVVPQLYGSAEPARAPAAFAPNRVVTTEELVDLSAEKEIPHPAAVPAQKKTNPAPERKPDGVKANTVDAAAGTGSWIQVGVFAHQERVTLLEKKLLKLGFPPQVDTLESAGAPRWRVRIGPFLDGPALGSALQRLNQLGIQGMRMSSPQ